MSFYFEEVLKAKNPRSAPGGPAGYHNDSIESRRTSPPSAPFQSGFVTSAAISINQRVVYQKATPST